MTAARSASATLSVVLRSMTIPPAASQNRAFKNCPIHIGCALAGLELDEDRSADITWRLRPRIRRELQRVDSSGSGSRCAGIRCVSGCGAKRCVKMHGLRVGDLIGTPRGRVCGVAWRRAETEPHRDRALATQLDVRSAIPFLSRVGASGIVNMNPEKDFSIVAVDKFIRATRDSGYKGTPSAVAELIDNALQAEATKISVNLRIEAEQADYPVVLSVIDNGTGMDASTLRMALRFGGSTRFNDRRGLGRYGMGLPNSSLSQAKRVTVHSWASSTSEVLRSYLDIDEITSGAITQVPEPTRVARPQFVNGYPSGTSVTWTRCDRLDNRRVSTLAPKTSVVDRAPIPPFSLEGRLDRRKR